MAVVWTPWEDVLMNALPLSCIDNRPQGAASGVEPVRAAIRTDREAVRGSGAGARENAVGGWQFRGCQCQQGEPHPPRARRRVGLRLAWGYYDSHLV